MGYFWALREGRKRREKPRGFPSFPHPPKSLRFRGSRFQKQHSEPEHVLSPQCSLSGFVVLSSGQKIQEGKSGNVTGSSAVHGLLVFFPDPPADIHLARFLTAAGTCVQRSWLRAVDRKVSVFLPSYLDPDAAWKR